MPDRKSKPVPPELEGSSDEALAAIDTIENAAEEAERKLRETIERHAAGKLAEKAEPGKA
jgi:hypothetical protein